MCVCVCVCVRARARVNMLLKCAVIMLQNLLNLLLLIYITYNELHFTEKLSAVSPVTALIFCVS